MNIVSSDGKRSHILELSGPDGLQVFSALASKTRMRILTLLAERDMNIGELAEDCLRQAARGTPLVEHIQEFVWEKGATAWSWS